MELNLNDRKSVVKLVTQVVITSSVTHVVGDFIDENTDPETRTDKVRNRIGSFALGGLAAQHAWERIEKKIDKGFELYDRFFGPDEPETTTEPPVE